MGYKRACLVLCLFCFVQVTFQQKKQKQPAKNKQEDVVTLKMFDDLKKELQDVWNEVNHLKEQQSLQTICLKGTKSLKRCYLSFSEPKTYHQASDVCIAQGGTLCSIDSKDENDFLYDYVRKDLGAGTEAWIGINDMAIEGVWVDMMGDPLSLKLWEFNQPDGGKQENCAALSAAATGKWMDKNCKEELPFVCQFSIV
ncbi:tetranectin [Gastrophryne carolinensis]